MTTGSRSPAPSQRQGRANSSAGEWSRRVPSDPWGLRVWGFSKVSGGVQACVVDVVADGLVNHLECVAELWRRWRGVGGQQGDQQPVVDLGVKQREPHPVAGEP